MTAGGRGFPTDLAGTRQRAVRSYDRGFYPQGVPRHMAAILATGDRRGALRFVRTPTLVIHGDDDPLVLPAAGRATAQAIPGARLQVIEGMGHDLPTPLYSRLVDLLAEHALGRS